MTTNRGIDEEKVEEQVSFIVNPHFGEAAIQTFVRAESMSVGKSKRERVLSANKTKFNNSLYIHLLTRDKRPLQ